MDLLTTYNHDSTNRDSVVGIATGYVLDDRGVRVRVPVGSRILFFSSSRQALWPTQPPIQWVAGGLSSGVKRPGREAHQSRPTSAEVKIKCGSIHPLPHTSSWLSAYLVKQRDIYTFLNTQLGTTSNYSATGNLHNSQITTAPAKPFPDFCLNQLYPGNGFQQWKFFSFKLSGPLFTASRAELTIFSNFLSCL
jgi:hypothetical protein